MPRFNAKLEQKFLLQFKCSKLSFCLITKTWIAFSRLLRGKFSEFSLLPFSTPFHYQFHYLHRRSFFKPLFRKRRQTMVESVGKVFSSHGAKSGENPLKKIKYLETNWVNWKINENFANKSVKKLLNIWGTQTLIPLSCFSSHRHLLPSAAASDLEITQKNIDFQSKLRRGEDEKMFQTNSIWWTRQFKRKTN